ncbi:hypothetical protein L9F63_025386 [Diploptera punctata]|uniref:Uncharacterized protein n=1 Tax=Diploptera punctata TaxID=6984 RepID=A0AAD8E4A0_DIPPU|nr:hypothetical protein L9F63_025386 [Diploptera punctata]
MLHIMQDYGEVVCVIGSSANADNMPIFLQADASLAVEPLYPQVCQKVAVFKETAPEQGPSPVELSRSLNSVACSISFRREDPISIFHLIMESRYYMQSVWNCVQFWICCGVTVSAVQVLGVFLMLPPVLADWRCAVVGLALLVPLISLSLVCSSSIIDRKYCSEWRTGKNQCVIDTQVSVFILWCYGSKFLPTVFMVLLFYSLTLSSLCEEIVMNNNTTCTMVYPLPAANVTLELWGGWSRYEYSLLTSQHTALILLVLHIDCDASNISPGIEHIPWQVLTLGLLSPLMIFVISELVKREEIKANVRYQKRARLEFGTKLGMNSPF